MAAKYQVRSVLRNFSSTLKPQQVRFKCWRLRMYFQRNGNVVVMDGVPVGNALNLGGTSVLEFGGVMANGEPLTFSQMFTFTATAATKNTIVFVEEYLDPIQ